MRVFGSPDDSAFVSFDPSTREGRLLFDKCEVATERKVTELIGARINLAHFYGQLVERGVTAEGEVIYAPRICLIDDKGEVWACMSNGIRQSIARLVRQEGQVPFPKPVPIVIKSKATGKPNDLLFFINDPEAPDNKRKT